MNNLVFVIVLSFIFFPSTIISQSYILKANNEIIPFKNGKYIKEIFNNSIIANLSDKIVQNDIALEKDNQVLGVVDTLRYSNQAPFSVNFGFNGGDVMMQYFVAPADIVVKAAGFSCSDDGDQKATVSVRLVKLNWTFEDLTNVSAPMNIGVYPSSGDGMGKSDFFGERASGSWEDLSNGQYPLPPWTNNVAPDSNTFEYDLWRGDSSIGAIIPIESASNSKVYQWVELDEYDTLNSGEVFAVVVMHNGENLEEDRIGFWADNSIGIPGWKYYEGGRTTEGDGWWARKYTWDFAVAVDIVSGPYIRITNVTKLLTTIETGPYRVEATIIDSNPSSGTPGIQSAELMYSLDACKTYKSIAMVNISGYIYAGDIPRQSPGTYITYFVQATDVEGRVSKSFHLNYSVVEKNNKELLVIFNGGSEDRAKQLVDFYIQGVVPKYDLWAAYGPVAEEILKFYDVVLEIHSEYGSEDNNQATFISFIANGGKKLAVVGQEVLGYLNGFKDSTFVLGDYEFDVLGVVRSFNDVNNMNDESESKHLPTVVKPIAETEYGDSLASWIMKEKLDTLFYDPTTILGMNNWIDQFEPRNDIGSEIFMTGYAMDGTERPIGHNYTDANGTEIFFMSADPLVLNSDSGWVGNSTLSPLVQFLKKNVVNYNAVNQKIPTAYSLSQNYPNPFNPSTTIQYNIPLSRGIRSARQSSEAWGVLKYVTLKVYDTLGRVVTTLVNKKQKSGSYKIDFNASQLANGVYFYTLNINTSNNNFQITKKMILLK